MRPFKEVLFDFSEALDIQVAERRTILSLIALYLFIKMFSFVQTDQYPTETEAFIHMVNDQSEAFSPKDAIPLRLAGGDEIAQITTVDSTTIAYPSSVVSTDTLTNRLVTVYINTATKEELLTLPGIGPAYAERILALRTDQGSFSSIEDLLLVKGIGPSRLEKLRPHIGLNSIDK